MAIEEEFSIVSLSFSWTEPNLCFQFRKIILEFLCSLRFSHSNLSSDTLHSISPSILYQNRKSQMLRLITSQLSNRLSITFRKLQKVSLPLVTLFGGHSSTFHFDFMMLDHSRNDNVPGNADRNFLPRFSLFLYQNLSPTFFIPAI